MQREILFRGFHKEENGKETIYIDGQGIKGKWVFGCGAYNDKVIAFIINYDVDLIKETSAFEHIQVIPETVGQWSGLDDRNGKKIFENDNLKMFQINYDSGEEDSWGVIHYDYNEVIIPASMEFIHTYKLIGEFLDDTEIIGTIFDKEAKDNE